VVTSQHPRLTQRPCRRCANHNSAEHTPQRRRCLDV